MGMLLAAMAGAGDAGVKSMDQEIEQLGRKEQLEQQAKLQLSTAQSLEQYKIDLADQVRKRDATELTTATDAEMDRRLVDKIRVGRGGAGEFDPASVTPEDRVKYALDEKERAAGFRAAALSTGQLSAKDAMALDHKEGQLAAQLQLGQTRLELQAAIGQARLEAIGAKGANNTDVRVAEGYLNLAKDRAKEIELMPDSNPQKAVLQKEITDLRTKALGLFNQAIGGPATAGASGGKPAPNQASFERGAKGGIGDEKFAAIASQEGLTPLQAKYLRATVGYESSNGTNAKTSVDGAMGPGQVMPGTFKQFAKPGEDIQNPDHNLAVAARYIKFLGEKTGDDPRKMAVGYLSGEGNINTKGDTPWIEDRKDGLGTTVSEYVNRTQARLKALDEADAKKAATPAAKPAGEKAAAAPAKAAGDPAKPLPPSIRESDVDARVAKATKARQEAEAKATWEAEAKAREKAARKEESSGLTLARIQQLNPREAQQMLAQYQDVLDPELARALRRRL